ncbi:MAG: Bro-N domain-containing protein [Candidatus Paceibacterota bacterium]
MGEQPTLPFAKDGEFKIDLFKTKEVRKVFDGGEWWFSVKDVLEALTDTTDGTRYASDLRKKDPGLNERYSEITRTLKYQSNRGLQETTFINIEGIFRLMQSVTTGEKSEAFKKWLAKVGFERIQEIANPELAITRAMAYYAAKGYPPDWIEARIQNKAARGKLELEWKERGIEGKQYAILTDAISIETFGVKTSKHKEIKGLAGQPLRDHMTPIELTLTTLGEQATTEIAKVRNSQGMFENLQASKSGGGIAGKARQEIELQTGRRVISDENYLTERQRKNASLPDGLAEIIEKSVHPDKE